MQAGQLHQAEELARVLRAADALDAERVERIAEDQVDGMLIQVAEQPGEALFVAEREAAPIERVDVDALADELPLPWRELRDPRGQLLGELLLRSLVLDDQAGDGLRYGEAEVVLAER
jgi:hypothetical protein